jgi:tRNA dimethylallyltransferase
VTVIGIFGPTASGKSRVAEAVAERLAGDLVSADAMQVYDGLPILTNQSPARLVAIWPLEHEASVGEYAPLAHAAIDEILAGGRTPVVVGGTGLYFRAALSALELPPPPEPGRREHWGAEVERLGPAAAHALLAERDAAAAARVHANDRKRLVRALELSEAGRSLAPATDRLWTEDTRHPTTIVALDLPLDELDRRIEARTRAMADAGAADEARAAWVGPLSGTARKILGLEQFATLGVDDAVDAVIQATRRLARYQRKWLRRMPGVVTLDANRSPEEIADAIVALGRAGERLPRHD